jgi:hypothetical protein
VTDIQGNWEPVGQFSGRGTCSSIMHTQTRGRVKRQPTRKLYTLHLLLSIVSFNSYRKATLCIMCPVTVVPSPCYCIQDSITFFTSWVGMPHYNYTIKQVFTYEPVWRKEHSWLTFSSKLKTTYTVINKSDRQDHWSLFGGDQNVNCSVKINRTESVPGLSTAFENPL